MRIARVISNIWPGHTNTAGSALFNALQHVREDYETGGVAKWQRPQKHALDNRENSGGGADTQRQHEHGSRCKSGRLQQMADSNAEIVEHGHTSAGLLPASLHPVTK